MKKYIKFQLKSCFKNYQSGRGREKKERVKVGEGDEREGRRESVCVCGGGGRFHSQCIANLSLVMS